MAPNSLGTAEKLKHRKLIDNLFKTGKSFSIFPYRVYYMDASWLSDRNVTGNQVQPERSDEQVKQPASACLFGVGVSKRYFKKAVDRNRVKRLTREAYRTQKQELVELLKAKGITLALFFIYTGKELPLQENSNQAVKLCLQKLIRILSNKI